MNKEKNVILGISGFGHDSSCAIVSEQDGRVLYAIADERISGRKNEARFPVASITASLKLARQNGWTIVQVALNYIPDKFISGLLFRELHREIGDKAVEITEMALRAFPFGDYFREGTSWSSDLLAPVLSELEKMQRAKVEKALRFYYNWAIKNRRIVEWVKSFFPAIPVIEVSHHLAHAVSAFYQSGFAEALVVTFDGSGEDDTHAVFLGQGTNLERKDQSLWPNSLGNLYLEVTHHLGFRLGDEYKVMGMSAYGKPRWAEELIKCASYNEWGCLSFQSGGWLRVVEHPTLRGYHYLTLGEELRKSIPRPAESKEFKQEHFDLAASVQRLTETIGVESVSRAVARSGLTRIAMAGGVCLNGLMNEAILKGTGCTDLFVFPAAGDDGTAVGAAQWVARAQGRPTKRLQTVFWGGETPSNEIQSLLVNQSIPYSEDSLIEQRIAAALAEGKIVAVYHGRSEFGPRALGNRSILANPTLAEMKDIVNQRIKHREAYRPFAPACLKEFVAELFDSSRDYPFMNQIVRAIPGAAEKIPAVVHADGSSRLQTVSQEENPFFHAIIRSFYERTKVPVVLNTSFNLNGEPIVETALDALESFQQMDIDFLALGRFWIEKNSMKPTKLQRTDKDFLKERILRFHQEINHPLRDINLDRWPFLDTNS